jgi:hypothetical protein
MAVAEHALMTVAMLSFGLALIVLWTVHRAARAHRRRHNLLQQEQPDPLVLLRSRVKPTPLCHRCIPVRTQSQSCFICRMSDGCGLNEDEQVLQDRSG